MNRRGVLGAALAALASWGVGLKARIARAAARVRPPGARKGEAFERACIRCFRCAEVCPTKAIRFEGALDLRQTDLPFLELRARPCVLCMKCTDVCPTGALAPIAKDPAIIQSSVKMGRPMLARRDCLSWNGTGVCRLCFYACPYAGTAVVLVGPQQAPLFDANMCVGCGLCEEACPDAARAIRIVPPEVEA